MILPNLTELKEINEKFENGAQYLTKDSFNFHAQLGSGAFGKVYKVSSKLTGSNYALKVLSKNQITNLKLTEQLKKEIAIIAKCNHENIIKLYGAFEDKSYIYLIMELANDSTLFSKLKKSKKLPESTAAAYLTDIVKAIVYLHSQKPAVIHRDLKPENILLSDGRCKIADFGWSNVTDEFRNTFCGTPDYLAPEMIIGTGHDEKLDVWTIGVMMFELIEGLPPFTAKDKINDARVMQKLIEKNILSGNIEFSKDISEDAKNAVRIMLNPKAEFRPSAKEILQLQFFKKHASGGAQGSGLNDPKASLDTLDTNQLRLKLAEYKDALVNRDESIKRLNDTLEKKEGMIRSLTRENETVTASQAKLMSEIGQLKGGNQKTASGSEVAELTTKYSQLTNELILEEERMAYVLRRMKHIAEVVSEFYQNHVLGVNAAPLPPQAITYESALLKLEQIFKDFVRYKQSALGRSESGSGNQTPRTNDSLNNFPDKSPVVTKQNIRNFSPMVNKPTEEKKHLSGSLDKILQDSKSALSKFFRKAD